MRRPVAILTGGEGGLAAALAEVFSGDGFEVLAPGREELDVRVAAAVERFFAPLRRVDVLVNSAGLSGDGLFVKQPRELRDEVIDVNLKGAHLCSRAAAGVMLARAGGGHIVHVGSYSALNPPPGQTAYAAAKAGLLGLTKSQAREFGPGNVRVNCVLPGFLETRMTAALPAEVREAALARHRLGRFNTVGEAARFVRFLAGTENISGQVFQLDSRV